MTAAVPEGGAPQPRVGKMYEILLRLVDDGGKLIPPMAFIPSAERYDLMPKIDRWVIQTLLQLLSEPSTPLPDNVLYTVNLSGATINDGQFVDFLAQQLVHSTIAPQQICFEITESVTITHLSRAADVMADLKQLGCRLTLDDFGSGMPSLAYLQGLPVDYLKIDGRLIQDMNDNPITYTVVDSINNIGHVMGLETIAEFVGDDHILATVETLGIDYAQGYGISMPLPLSSILA